MSVIVLPVAKEDFAQMRKFVNSRDGQLTSVAVDHSMPVEDDEAADVKNKWSLQLQEEIFSNDSTAHFMKAVDEDGTILSLAHWHFYRNGYVPSDLQYAGLKDMNDPSTYPAGLNVGLYKTVLGSMINERRNWTGDGPQWILTNIKTRSTARRMGAGSALVKWGIERARQDGCPAYLEADPAAVSVYEKLGFEACGEIPVDLSPHGIPEVYILKKMVANK